MKRLLKISIYSGTLYGGYTYYNNHIKAPPQDPHIKDLEKRKVVVVGAGIVGLSTAYYLS
jgi:NADPH-dependent 2,4-dienoyl-CoA reductase/sulfur reductase-like enzyme